jgi:hypothetical protein
MGNGLHTLSSMPAFRLLSNGGPSSAFQLARRTTTTKGLFEVDSVVAIYDHHDEAERAIRTLQAGGIDMRTLSVAARDPELMEHVTGYYTAGDRMFHRGKLGAFWGILSDSALFAIPGIGPIVLAGPLVAWIVAILEGAVVVGGLSALGAGLVSIGIPRQSVIEYETALTTNKFLLIVHGTRREVTKAKEIIGKTQPQFHTVHSERAFAN